MKILFILISVCLPVNGFFVAVSEEGPVSVIVGDLLTLNTDVMIKQEDIRWYFNGILIAYIAKGQWKICTDVQCDQRFRDRLKMNLQTGSLTIINIRITDSGEYKLQIRNGTILEKIFDVTVYGDSTDQRNQMTRKSVNEGEPVTLVPVVKKPPNDVRKWYFIKDGMGDGILIAEITGDQSKICTNILCDERFRGRLKLNRQTGSLTVMNTRITDSGVYTFEISNTININGRQVRNSKIRRFGVTVTDSDLSSAAIGKICAGVVALLAAVVSAVIYYRRRV